MTEVEKINEITPEVKEVKDTKEVINKEVKQTKLYCSFCFWFKLVDEYNNYQHHNNKQIKQEDYSDMVKKIAEFNTVEDFWEVYQFLKKPEQAKHGLEISLFKSGLKPMWEDPGNKNGGKISLKIKKEYSNLIWDELVYRLIGNNFPLVDNDEINGLVFSLKRDSNFVQVWFRTFNQDKVNAIINCIRKIMNIPDGIELDIRPFNRSKEFEKEKK